MRARRGPIQGGAGAQPPRGIEAFLLEYPLATAGLSPRQLMEEERRHRILVGALKVFGEKAYARATVQDLIDASGISRATFYKYFADSEACLDALHEKVLLWLEREARAAIGAASGWPAQARAGTETLVELLGSDPRVGRIWLTEAAFSSERIRARRDASLDALAAALRQGRAHSRWGDRLPAALEEFLIAGALSFAIRSADGDRAEPPPGLGAEAAELVLLPYLGATRARKLIRGSGLSHPPPPPAGDR